MADIGLLNIRQETLDKLLKEDVNYEIPFFQREYSWSKDEWRDFLEDAEKAMKDNKKHFFGFMTFRQEKEDKYLIIEGQQRITTVTILLAVVRDIFYEFKDDYWKRLEDFVKTEDPFSPSEPASFKLTLSELNRDFFQDHIQTVDKTRDKIKRIENQLKINLSNKNIFDCYKYFHSELTKSIHNLTPEERKNYLRDIVRVALRNFVIVRTEVVDNKAAFNIFQTLNDRGLDLTITDLIKIYLFALVDPSWDVAKEKWDDIRETLSLQNTNSFFRHYWLSKEGVVKEKELLDAIEKKVKRKRDVFAFLDILRDEAEYYEALLSPSKYFWEKRSQEIVELLEELHILSKQQPMPLLMACCKEDRLPTGEFIKLIRMCINFIFRYLTIAERENKELERLFSDIAIDVRKGKIKNTKGIKPRLLRASVDDETFLALFSKKQIKSARVAKYILRKIENHISHNAEKVAKKITLEHILPKAPDHEWKKYLKDHSIDKDDYIYRLGNMTLLLQKPNREAKNSFFITKRDDIYKKQTKLQINKDLATIIGWTGEDIKKRQKWLAEKALRIWRIEP